MAGRLQAATVVTAEAEILSTIVPAPQPPHLVLDLTEVESIDSSGVSLPAKAHFAAQPSAAPWTSSPPTTAPPAASRT